MLQLVRNQLVRIIHDIDTGNSSINDEDAKCLLDKIVEISEPKLSKYQAMHYINCSRASFDRLIENGKLPQGKHQQGFKELFWKKSDIDKYIKNITQMK